MSCIFCCLDVSNIVLNKTKKVKFPFEPNVKPTCPIVDATIEYNFTHFIRNNYIDLSHFDSYAIFLRSVSIICRWLVNYDFGKDSVRNAMKLAADWQNFVLNVNRFCLPLVMCVWFAPFTGWQHCFDMRSLGTHTHNKLKHFVVWPLHRAIRGPQWYAMKTSFSLCRQMD